MLSGTGQTNSTNWLSYITVCIGLVQYTRMYICVQTALGKPVCAICLHCVTVHLWGPLRFIQTFELLLLHLDWRGDGVNELLWVNVRH